MSSRSRGILARIAVCPKGCKNPATGKLFDVGQGGCDECVRFSRQTVAQQCVIGAKLIEAENERLHAEASSAIPMPTSPNKEAKKLATDAQSILVSMEHASKQAARDISKPKQPIQKGGQGAKKPNRDETEFDLVDETLIETAVVGVEVEIRPSPGMGDGLFTMMRLSKGKRGADYMGHRLFKDGTTAMFCKKTETLLANLPAAERDILLLCNKLDKWSLNVGNKPFAATHIPKFHLRSSVPCQVPKQRWLQRGLCHERIQKTKLQTGLVSAEKPFGFISNLQLLQWIRSQWRLRRGLSRIA